MNRYMIVLDKQANGSLPPMGDVIDPVAVWGGRELDNRKRFKIMLDKVRYSAAAAQGDPSRIYVHHYIKLRHPIITDYNSTAGGTVNDIATNSIFIALFGDNAANYPLCDKLWFRLRYTDN